MYSVGDTKIFRAEALSLSVDYYANDPLGIQQPAHKEHMAAFIDVQEASEDILMEKMRKGRAL